MEYGSQICLSSYLFVLVRIRSYLIVSNFLLCSIRYSWQKAAIMITRSKLLCPFCEKIFVQTKIVLHIALQCAGLSPKSEELENTEDSEELTNCENCPQISKNGHKCKECLETFETKPSMIQHFRSEHSEKLYRCNMCDKTFMNRKRRNMHAQRELILLNNNN